MRAFDKAWCLYLYCFMAWKVKNAKLFRGAFGEGYLPIGAINDAYM